jgi:ADP-ribose pyrophosphatase
LIHRGVKFDLELVTGTSDSGQHFSREAIRHPGSVIMLPVRAVGGVERIVMIRNFRLSLGAWLLELPAGTMTPGEDPAACAHRELVEETGMVAATLEPVCRFHAAPGLADELMHAFIARDLTPAAQALEVDERIQVAEMPTSEIFNLLDSGQITDAKTMMVLMLCQRRGLIGR